MKRETRHIPVLADEVLASLSPRAGDVVVDCTLGLGGHAAKLLAAVTPGGKLIGLDLDPKNIEIARGNLQSVGGEFELYHSNFAGLPGVLQLQYQVDLYQRDNFGGSRLLTRTGFFAFSVESNPPPGLAEGWRN